MHTIKPLKSVRQEINIPADKSISHRAAIISSLAKGKTLIKPYLLSEDTLATLSCLRKLGVRSALKNDSLTIAGRGLYFSPKEKLGLNALESGTTLRILSGVLIGQKFPVIFDASPSLARRPMRRVTYPLRQMGAEIRGEEANLEEYPPLRIDPAGRLSGINYALPVASAQVKSAIILASLYAEGETQVIEPAPSRDHTERLLSKFKAKIKREGDLIVSSAGGRLISPGRIFIPGDFSSAAFFIVLGLILPDAKILLRNVNINPTRCGLLNVLKRMGAKIKVFPKKSYFEPYADIKSESSQLVAAEVKETEIPLLIDEVPALCVAASFAKGTTRIWGAGELKVKETDRINSLLLNLKKAGVRIDARRYVKDAHRNWVIEISGGTQTKPCAFKSFSDHRTAMSLVVFGLAGERESTLDNTECIGKSFPQFLSLIGDLKK